MPIETISDFLANDMGLSFHCSKCETCKPVNLRRLGELKGMDFSLYSDDLGLRCPVCKTSASLSYSVIAPGTSSYHEGVNWERG